MLFRKFLVRIRREYNQQPRRLFLWSGIGTVLGTVIAILLDAFLPFGGWGNLVRSGFLLPYSVTMFILGYAVSLFLHYAKTSGDPNWIPYRLRLSPTWRRRVSAVVAAIMVVVLYANGYRIGYTIISSIFVVIVIALFAFMRTTKDEAAREELNIPDVRDTRFERELRLREEARQAAQRAKERNRENRRRERLGLDPIDDDSED